MRQFVQDTGTGLSSQQEADFLDAASLGALAAGGSGIDAGCTFSVTYTTPEVTVTAGQVRVLTQDLNAIDHDGDGNQTTWDEVVQVYKVDQTTLSLTDSATNHVYLQGDQSTPDSASLVVNTTGSAPSGPTHKLGEIDTTNDTKSEQWGLIAPDGTLTYPDKAAAQAVSLADGTVVYVRDTDTHYGVVAGSLKGLVGFADPDGDGTYTLPSGASGISVGSVSADDGTFTDSITDPSDKQITSEIATLSQLGFTAFSSVSSDYTASDREFVLVTSDAVVTLPSPTTRARVAVSRAPSGPTTNIKQNGNEKIIGSTERQKIDNAGETAYLLSDGADWFRVGDTSLTADPPLSSSATYWWRTNEGSGTTLFDRNDSENMTINGASWATGSGTNNSFLSYDGTDDECYTGTSNSTWGDTTFTMTCWFLADNTDSRYYIVFGETSGGEGWSLTVESDSDLRFFLNNAAGGSNVDLVGKSISTGTWVFIAGVADLGNNEAYLYAAEASESNLTQVGSSSSYDDGGGNVSNVEKIALGSKRSDSTNHLAGDTDNAEFFSGEARSQSQLETWFDDTKGLYT